MEFSDSKIKILDPYVEEIESYSSTLLDAVIKIQRWYRSMRKKRQSRDEKWLFTYFF